MKLLFLHPRSFTGDVIMLRALQERGHVVCALEEDRSINTARKFTDFLDVPDDGIATLRYHPGRGVEKILTWPLDKFYKPHFDGRNLGHRVWMIRAAVRHFKPDALVCGDGFTYAIPAAFAKRWGLIATPLAVNYIGGDILQASEVAVGKKRTARMDALLKTSYVHVDLMRPHSPMLADALVADGVARERIHVLPVHLTQTGAVLRDIAARKAKIGQDLRVRLGWPEDGPVIATLSGNQRGKGLQTLVEALPTLVRALPNLRWLLCGPTDPFVISDLRPRLQALGLMQLAHETGRLSGSAPFEHLAAADLHLAPSFADGLNLVTVEAAAVGTPTVTTDAAGVATYVRQYQAGKVVPAGDAAALATAIIEAFSTSQMTQVRAGAEALAQAFDLDSVADRWSQLLQQLPGTPA
jgi:glycosyltransferase involved in cell wall biosynthesis